jgi:hypothetical protein
MIWTCTKLTTQHHERTQGWRVAPPAGLVLYGFEHAGTLGSCRDDGGVEAELACGCTNIRATSFYSVGEDPDHDAVMRIGSESSEAAGPFWGTA